MTTIDLKRSIQQKVEKIEDRNLLEEVNAIIDYITNEAEDWNNLPEELKIAIEEGLMQLDSGNKLSYEEVKRRHSKWFTQ